MLSRVARTEKLIRPRCRGEGWDERAPRERECLHLLAPQDDGNRSVNRVK
jgi:hypothetical protein